MDSLACHCIASVKTSGLVGVLTIGLMMVNIMRWSWRRSHHNTRQLGYIISKTSQRGFDGAKSSGESIVLSDNRLSALRRAQWGMFSSCQMCALRHWLVKTKLWMVTIYTLLAWLCVVATNFALTTRTALKMSVSIAPSCSFAGADDWTGGLLEKMDMSSRFTC
jgi:Flp pilus assembly protein TadB